MRDLAPLEPVARGLHPVGVARVPAGEQADVLGCRRIAQRDDFRQRGAGRFFKEDMPSLRNGGLGNLSAHLRRRA